MVGVDYSSLILTVEVGWFLLQRVGGRLALIIHCESKRWRCTLFQLTDFCRTMLSISAAYAVYAVFICLSVCLSVRLSRSWILSKQIKIASIFFHRLVATPFFHTKRYGSIPTGPLYRGRRMQVG